MTAMHRTMPTLLEMGPPISGVYYCHMFRIRKYVAALVLPFLIPFVASAHEVYVLTPGEIQGDLRMPSFSEWQVIFTNIHEFMFWAFIAFLVVTTVFCISIFRPLERLLMPTFARLRPYAAPIARITIGLSFLAAAYYGATYGPELPIASTFGHYAIVIRILLVCMGVLIISGFYVRMAALSALVLFSIAVYFHGIYMLTYTNYLGEIITLLILGAHRGEHRHYHESKLAKLFAPYSFVLLRVAFGISLLYASFYAKILHNNLALQVATLPLAGHRYGVAHYLGFEPHFLVLGAAIIEIVIAVFFMLGIEIRWTSIFLLFWLSLSLSYFGEVVWPHVILIGIPLAFICYGYDKYSLEGYFFKDGAREPVL
jgi:hypothetical protein